MSYLICIDAGHGGTDSGAVNGSRKEKDDNLRMALAVQRALMQYGQRVIMTRMTDIFLSLTQRTDLANSNNCDAFVSLHRNSGVDSANGVEIWVHHKKPVTAVTLAKNILTEIDTVGVQSDRGVKYGYRGSPTEDYAVNRQTKMTSCLTELGFISNTQDNVLFDNKLNDYAVAIAEAIITSLGGTIPSEPAPDPAPGTPQPPPAVTQGSVIIAPGTWNVRQSPNMSGKVVALVRGGEIYGYTEVSDGWYQISAGWIGPNAAAKGNIQTPQKAIQVKPGTWYVRKTPDNNGTVVKTIKGDQTIVYTNIVDGWYQIDGGYLGPKAAR